MKNVVVALFTSCLLIGCGPDAPADNEKTTSVPVTTVDTAKQRLEAELAVAKKEIADLKSAEPREKVIDFGTEKTSYMVNIDWLHGNTAAPAKLICTAYVVSGGGAPKLRGMASANDCLMNAIAAYRDNNADLAINWLCAGQCHNNGAQDDFRAHKAMALQYAYQTYGK